MNLIERYKKLTFWNKIAFWGSLASIVAFVSIFIPKKQNIYLIHSQKSTQERPFLVPKLIANPPAFTIDGQSIMMFILMNDNFLYARFRIRNTSDIPAINVRAKYDSPTQKNVSFDMGENVILPNSFSERFWTPWINIQSEVNKQSKYPFDIILTIEYDGNDSKRFITVFKLSVKKETHDKYRLTNEKVTFDIKEN